MLLNGASTPAVVQRFAYDAYGVVLTEYHLTASVDAITTLLYSGEQTDKTGLQYLRARYYDPSTGRFNSLDPFAGDSSDPLSLHKYSYTHGDPINGIDPSGESIFWLLSTLRISLERAAISAQLGAEAYLAANPVLAQVALYGAAGMNLVNAYLDPADAANDIAAYGPANFIDDIWDLVRNSSSLGRRITHPFAFIGQPDTAKRATGVVARLTRDAVDSARGTSARIDPEGWAELAARVPDPAMRNRGHLLPRWFGGGGSGERWRANLVPLHRAANKQMLDVETLIANGLTRGDYSAVFYRVTPVYNGGSAIPTHIYMEAWQEFGDGTLQLIIQRTINNSP